MKKFLLLLIIVSISAGLNGKRISRLSELTNPSIMMSDRNQIYVLDGYQVSIFSLKNYKRLYRFGKKGEGPGELLAQPGLPLTISLNEDNVMLKSFNKIIYFTKKGKFIKEKRIPFLAVQVLPFGKGYAATRFSRNNDGGSSLEVALYDDKFNKIKIISNVIALNDQGKGKIAYPILAVHIRINKDVLYIVDQQKNFQIDQFDLKGNKIKTLSKEYQKIKITNSLKKEKLDWIKIQPAFKNAPERFQRMIYFLDFLPTINHFLVDDQNIYVQTSKQKEEMVEFVILNKKGEVAKQVMLPNGKIESISPTPAANYFFKKGAYYFLKEVEEEWELHRVKL